MAAGGRACSSPAAAAANDGATRRSGQAAQTGSGHFRMGDWQLQHVPWRRLPLNGGPAHADRDGGSAGPRWASPCAASATEGARLQPDRAGPAGHEAPGRLAADGRPRPTCAYARKIVEKLDEISLEVRQRRWQPHEYDLVEQESGWVNANSHGLVQSFLSRFYALTGSAGRLKDARRMMAAYQQRPGDPRWFTLVSRNDYLWFEHWPHGRSVHTLNAHINALFGLYDYWSQTGSPKAAALLPGRRQDGPRPAAPVPAQGAPLALQPEQQGCQPALPPHAHPAAAQPGPHDRRRLVRPAGAAPRARREAVARQRPPGLVRADPQRAATASSGSHTAGCAGATMVMAAQGG